VQCRLGGQRMAGSAPLAVRGDAGTGQLARHPKQVLCIGYQARRFTGELLGWQAHLL